MEYITLISDASSDIFPTNTIGEFRVKLAHKISIDRERQQIGLKYISWPHKTINIADGSFDVEFHTLDPRVGWPKRFRGGVRPGYYETPQTLVDELNDAFKAVPSQNVNAYREVENEAFKLQEGHLRFHYDHTTEKVRLRTNKAYQTSLGGMLSVCVQLSEELYVKLGYGLSSDYGQRSCLLEAGWPKWVADPTPPKYVVDLSLGQTSLFVYTDIIEADRLVGNQLLNLLSLVPAVGKHNTQQSYEPRSVEYCTPRFDQFDEIFVSIRGDTGKPVTFSSGKVYLTLHIKDKFG